MLRQESQELVERLLARFAVSGADEVTLLRAVAFVNGFGPSARDWNSRLAEVAARIDDREALATATGNLFGQALNARDRGEMARLRPALLALLRPGTSTRALGWAHYFLALDAYVDGRLDDAARHAAGAVEQAEAAGHEFMIASAVGTGLLAQSARDGTIERAALAGALDRMRRPGVAPLSAFALWLAARYAAGVDAEAAGRWLAHGERILAALDSQLWPESVLRDETLSVLGIADLAALVAGVAPLDHVEALDEAIAWVAARDPAERSPREVAAALAIG
jgi:hypothetical protein